MPPYLTSRKEPGKTRERTVYELTEKGVAALRAWGATPASFPRVSGDPSIRMVGADLIGEPATRAGLLAMRDELEQLRRELDEGEERARTIPHRTKYLLLNHRLARRVIDVYDEWLDDVERELNGV